MQSVQNEEKLSTFTAAIDEILSRPSLRRSRVGMAFYDAESKKPLFERESDKLYAGASTTKIVTSATALWALGQDYRFVTNVERRGEIDADGTLDGDLVLAAVGDPNLSGRINGNDGLDFCDVDHSLARGYAEAGVVDRDPLLVINALADNIVQSGIRRINGDVRVDLAFADAGPEGGTGVSVSAVSINDNLLDLVFTGGASEGDPVAVHVSPETNYVRFVNYLKTAGAAEEANLQFVDRLEEGCHVVDVFGSVASKQSVRSNYAVSEPAAFAASALAGALTRRGVKINRSSQRDANDGATPASVVATHRSPPLHEAVKVVLKVSQNMHAELLPRVVARHRGADFFSAGDSFSATHEFLASLGISSEGAYQGDGCGALGTFTPKFMCELLCEIRSLPFGAVFDAALPVLGNDGTLHAVQTASLAAATKAIRAKTGTLGYIDRISGKSFTTAKALAGYMTTASGSKLAFTIFATSIPISTEDAGQLVGEIAVAAQEIL